MVSISGRAVSNSSRSGSISGWLKKKQIGVSSGAKIDSYPRPRTKVIIMLRETISKHKLKRIDICIYLKNILMPDLS